MYSGMILNSISDMVAMRNRARVLCTNVQSCVCCEGCILIQLL